MNSTHVLLGTLRLFCSTFAIIAVLAAPTFISSCNSSRNSSNIREAGSFAVVAIASATTSAIGTTIEVAACIPGHTVSCQTDFPGGGTGVFPIAGSGSNSAVCENNGTVSMTVVATATSTFSSSPECNLAYAFCTDVTTGAALQTLVACEGGSSPAYAYLAGSGCTLSPIIEDSICD